MLRPAWWLAFSVLVFAACTETPADPLRDAAAGCDPACRPGFVCSRGVCVSACNPPCAAGEMCTPDLRCVGTSPLVDGGPDVGPSDTQTPDVRELDTPLDTTVTPPSDTGPRPAIDTGSAETGMTAPIDTGPADTGMTPPADTGIDAGCGGLTRCGAACVDTRTDPTHCGGCGNRCNGLNGRATCVTGACVVACNVGFGNCDSDVANGCEASLDTTANCGRCGNACGAGLACVAGACAGGETFRVTGFGTTGCRILEHRAVTGDDRGGIALAGTQVFYTGDDATGRFSALDLSGGARVGRLLDAMVSDLATGTAYTLAESPTTPLSGAGTVTHLIELDGASGALTTRAIALSAAVVMDTGAGIFSGYGRILLHTGDGGMRQWVDIRLPGGTVTVLRRAPTLGRTPCETWAYWGIVEYVGGEHYALCVQGNNILRYRVRDDSLAVVASFTALANMCSITFSPARNRWYFHHSGSSQFSPGIFSDEVTGYCDGTWSTSGP